MFDASGSKYILDMIGIVTWDLRTPTYSSNKEVETHSLGSFRVTDLNCEWIDPNREWNECHWLLQHWNFDMDHKSNCFLCESSWLPPLIDEDMEFWMVCILNLPLDLTCLQSIWNYAGRVRQPFGCTLYSASRKGLKNNQISELSYQSVSVIISNFGTNYEIIKLPEFYAMLSIFVDGHFNKFHDTCHLP
jgi:hypothetical protein